MNAAPTASLAALSDADFDATLPRTADDVARLARRLYGQAFAPTPGVLHVTAVDGNTGRTLRIDEHTPKSLADTFALSLARARADAIVITGKLLRDEPALSYAPGAPGPLAPALAAFRQSLGRDRVPLLVIMTRGSDLPLDHAVFHDGHTRPVVYGPSDGVSALRGRTPAEVVGTETDANLAGLVAYLRSRAATTISFEAGPSTTRHLYDGPAPLLDELCLSTYAGAPLADAQLAGELARVPATLTLTHEAALVQAESGPWRFARYRRG